MTTSATKNPKRWRPRIAYGLMSLIIALVLMNLVTDALVTRYDAQALRDPETGYLDGMVPRQLGPKDSAKAVLFVHGFIGAQSNFNTLPDAVAATGWYVETLRLPGHGTSPRDFERGSADDLVDGVREAVVNLQKTYPKVVIVGHSMGGALATLVAAELPVDGLVLCAPFFGLHYDRILGVKTAWLAPRIAPVLRWLPGRPGNGPVAKPEGRKHIDCYGWIPMAGVLTALEVSARAGAPSVLAEVQCPVLAIHSRADTVTSQAATARALEGMSGASVQSTWLEKSDHVIFWDYDEALVQEQIRAFLQEFDHP